MDKQSVDCVWCGVSFMAAFPTRAKYCMEAHREMARKYGSLENYPGDKPKLCGYRNCSNLVPMCENKRSYTQKKYCSQKCKQNEQYYKKTEQPGFREKRRKRNATRKSRGYHDSIVANSRIRRHRRRVGLDV